MTCSVPDRGGCRCAAQVDDLAQVAILKLVTILRDANPHVDDHRAYVAQIARNTFIEDKRRKRALKNGGGIGLEPYADDFSNPADFTVNRRLAEEYSRERTTNAYKEELYEALAQALARLKPESAAEIEERYKKGQTLKQIARNRGISLSAASARLNKTMKQLRRCLSRKFPQ